MAFLFRFSAEATGEDVRSPAFCPTGGNLMKIVFKTLLAATALAASLFAANAQDIIVVSHGQASDPFWSVVKNGVAQAATDMGVNVDYRAPETFDMVAMAQLIDAAVNQNPA